MTSPLLMLCVDAIDPPGLARFWAGLLGRETAPDPRGGIALPPGQDAGLRLRFVPTREPKAGANPMHLHLTSTSLQDQQATVARALGLGGRHLDVGQRPEEEHVVLADPEDNEFCVIEPGNRFLAGCGFLGELTCDGSQAVGYFWSAALGWPLVWDQDQETAIQSPAGGTKVSWGGPPLMPRSGRDRLHLDLVPVHADQRAEVDRLVSLGATRVDPDGNRQVGPVVLADPDGNEFWVCEPEEPPAGYQA